MLIVLRQSLLLIVFLSFFPNLVAADIYKWIDDQGGIHFTDNYESIPEIYRTKNRVTIEEKQSTKSSETSQTQGTGSSPETTGPSSGAKSLRTVKVDKNGHDEEWWNQRVMEVKDKLRQLLKEKGKLESDLQELSKRYRNPAFGSRGRKTLEPEVEDLQKKIKALDENITEIKETLEKTLPEEAAKAEAPAEWLR